jgi:hypothetical protein
MGIYRSLPALGDRPKLEIFKCEDCNEVETRNPGGTIVGRLLPDLMVGSG